MNARRITIAALPLLLVACAGSGPAGDSISFESSSFDGFPAQTLESDVYAVASFPRDHKRRLGIDLIEKHNVLPIEVSVQLGKDVRSDKTILLKAENVDFALYLPDGTVLSPMSPDEVARPLKDKHAEKVLAEAFRPGLLKLEENVGFVYFHVTPSKDFAVSGTRIKHASGGVARPLDLTRALLSFNVTIGNDVEPFYIGLQR